MRHIEKAIKVLPVTNVRTFSSAYIKLSLATSSATTISAIATISSCIALRMSERIRAPQPMRATRSLRPEAGRVMEKDGSAANAQPPSMNERREIFITYNYIMSHLLFRI